MFSCYTGNVYILLYTKSTWNGIFIFQHRIGNNFLFCCISDFQALQNLCAFLRYERRRTYNPVVYRLYTGQQVYFRCNMFSYVLGKRPLRLLQLGQNERQTERVKYLIYCYNVYFLIFYFKLNFRFGHYNQNINKKGR